MQFEYSPDSWTIVRIKFDAGTIFKVLCSWYGGYARADYWKLSSGCESIEEIDGGYRIQQSSGSVYMLYGTPRMSSLMYSVFSNFESDAKDGKFIIEQSSIEELKKFLENGA